MTTLDLGYLPDYLHTLGMECDLNIHLQTEGDTLPHILYSIHNLFPVNLKVLPGVGAQIEPTWRLLGGWVLLTHTCLVLTLALTASPFATALESEFLVLLLMLWKHKILNVIIIFGDIPYAWRHSATPTHDLQTPFPPAVFLHHESATCFSHKVCGLPFGLLYPWSNLLNITLGPGPVSWKQATRGTWLLQLCIIISPAGSVYQPMSDTTNKLLRRGTCCRVLDGLGNGAQVNISKWHP